MEKTQIAKTDLDLANHLFSFHGALMQFAHYNHGELSPEALAILHKWLLGPSQVLEDAKALTQQGVSACVAATPVE